MCSLNKLATLVLIGVALVMPAACEKAADRQMQWDTARAENRCEQGYQAYCNQLANIQK